MARLACVAELLAAVCATALAWSGPDDGAWFEVAPLPVARAFHMTTFCETESGPRLYAVGGQRSPSDTMERLCVGYSPGTNSWQQVAAMRYRRGLGQACAVRGKVYVLGGYETFGSGLANVEVYSPATNTWTAGPAMPESTYDFGAAVWRDSLVYLLGGGSWHPARPPTDAVWVFDPVASTWHPATPLPESLGALCCGIVGDTIMVATGWTESGPTNAAWKGYIDPQDPSVIFWYGLDTLPGPRRCRAAGGVANGELYVIGGLEGQDRNPPRIPDGVPSLSDFSVLSDVWSLSAATEQWRRHSDKPNPVSDVSCSGPVAAGHLYVAGGYSGTLPYLRTTECLDVAAHEHDVGVTGIVSPAGRLVPGDSCPVTVSLRNFGNASETLSAGIAILDSASQMPVFDHDTFVAIDPDSSVAVMFGEFRPDDRAVFHATAWVSLAGDENPANDTSTGRSRTTSGSDPDGFGYIYESSQEPDTVRFAWFNPAGGAVIDDWDPNPDEGTSRRRLPFKFRFYADSTDRLYVCTNGYLQTSITTSGLNFPLPFEAITDLIAPLWDDLDLRESGTVYESFTEDQAIYTWIDAARVRPDTSRLTFQVTLERGGKIRFNYLKVAGGGSSSTVGIQGDDGSWNWYQEYVYNAEPLKHVPADSTSILFRAPAVSLAEPPFAIRHSPFAISPNPCRGRATVRFSSLLPRSSTLTLFDVAGRVVLQSAICNLKSEMSLYLHSLPAGAYIVRVAWPSGGLTRSLLLLD